MKTLRHGDLIFTKVSSLPNGAVKTLTASSLVVQEGEHTGHKHVAVAKRPITEYSAQGVRYFRFDAPAKITHPEHKELTFEPGIYQLTPEREYDYFTEKINEVRD